MSIARRLIVAIFPIILFGCQVADDPAEQPGAIPELAQIGGVQDVWGFDFGMDANRTRVRVELGEPESVMETSATGGAVGPQLERWFYDGFQVTFLINEPEEYEILLAVRIEDPAVPVRGGLWIGMPLDEAFELLGEPRVVDGASHVYFYRDATIELIARGPSIEAIQLSRALP